MELTTGIIFITIFVGIFLLLLYGSERKMKTFVLPESYRNILQQYVPFYNLLYNNGKKEFEERMQQFLSHVRITGVKTKVEEIDIVFIAASAIIPIFNFKNWQYTNLNEVLLYPDAFNEEYNFENKDGNFGGMVGWGAMQNQMILSQPELRAGFLLRESTRNTAVHEFVHLVDKTDGATDGIPENIMDRQYILPWLQLMKREIQKISEGTSDIDPYGATSQTEFFAVVSEYFFEQPELLKKNHPELFALLEKIFLPQPQG